MVDTADYTCHGRLLLTHLRNPDAYSLIEPERSFYLYPPSQKTTSLPVVEFVINRLLQRDVAHNLGG